MKCPCASVENFSFAYDQGGIPALTEINFQLAKGEILLVTGPPKAGKTTLGLALSGVLGRFFARSYWMGKVSVAGIDVSADTFEQIIFHTGFLFENPALQISGTKPTVSGEVAGVLQNMGIAHGEIRDRVSAVLDQLAIGHLSDRNPVELSGGETQKVALATVLVKEPGLVVLDQPFSQLDPASTGQLSGIIKALSRQGRGVVLLEGDGSRWSFADTELRLEDGKASGYGPRDKIPTWLEIAQAASARAKIDFNGSTRYADCMRILRRIQRQYL